MVPAFNLSQDYSAFGPIAPLLADQNINDILVNGHNEVFIERNGILEKTSITFPDENSVYELAKYIVKMVGRTLEDSRPMVDARLADGSRVNIIAPPLSVDGTTISIRKFSAKKLSLDDMATRGTMSEAMAEFLKIAARIRMNIIISGGTGSGKTTLLNAISNNIGAWERVVTIEDAAELQLQLKHVVRLETQPAVISDDGMKEEVTIRDLVKNSLRMRPDRIIVGEVRGAEAFDMLQAMNTGHEGSLTTIHANHPRDALTRLDSIVSLASVNSPLRAVRAQIASAVHLIVQISRQRDGRRIISFISEIAGMEGDIITMNELFNCSKYVEDQGGRETKPEFKWTGVMPRCLRRVSYYGETDRLAKALGVKIPKV